MGLNLEEALNLFADYATASNESVLAHICKIAALEAQGKDISVPLTNMSIVGLWDWDAVNDINHLDEGCAELFGVDPVQARSGMSINDYMKAVHPDDVGHLTNAIMHTLKAGGPIEVRYRVMSNGRVRHVLARGVCTLDKSGRAERFPGVILELRNYLANN